MGVDFGVVLKEWRQVRRVSQLDLGLSAGVSSRHISFLETGRSRPSRGMVLRLCDELEVPIAQRNRMLTAAGMSPAYAERALSAEDMAPMRAAVEWTLKRHEPYPAIAMDRHWCLVAMNAVSERLMAGFGVAVGGSLVDMMVDSKIVRQALVNYDEILRHMVARLRVESAHFGHDPVLEDGILRMQSVLGDGALSVDGIKPAIIPAVYDFGGMRLSLFSTISQFGSAEDIALSELRIEMMFPSDEATRLTLEALAGA
ncbi:helix-turn-helix transcriptional regulator [uncultured Shimia sp.]|uniref:helix-turn-helix domain-containing protein n=1 Tax=uncultured Shimia sp. TaxID=573152 RepID=UPI0025DDB94A|nr:helix-turn-helix transcriptional regulator [uncultured Shimia sp.]